MNKYFLLLKPVRILEALRNAKFLNRKTLCIKSKVEDSYLDKTIKRYRNLDLVKKTDFGKYALTEKGLNLANHIYEIRELTK